MGTAQMYARMVAVQWHVLCGAVRSLREDNDEGMGTLEVLVIAAGLVALATTAIVIIRNQAQTHTGTIETPPSTYLT